MVESVFHTVTNCYYGEDQCSILYEWLLWRRSVLHIIRTVTMESISAPYYTNGYYGEDQHSIVYERLLWRRSAFHEREMLSDHSD